MPELSRFGKNGIGCGLIIGHQYLVNVPAEIKPYSHLQPGSERMGNIDDGKADDEE
jgi:hypothetical protein